MSEELSLLENELSTQRKTIKTDSYAMSIGEIINLYKDGDLELNPAYQRLFRWSDKQKSRFIESILLGIPVPPIFVAQKQDGVWSIVDGVQRISTILQLTGELENWEPLILTTTKKLPSLEGHTWATLPEDIKRTLRRSKIGINIILTENSIQAQYELFQRLNTGGLFLMPQEVRNCLIIMLDESFYDNINKLKRYPSFVACLPLQEEKFEIEYHMELILRFFIAKHANINYDNYKFSSTYLSDFIDDETTNLIESNTFDIKEEERIFCKTFDWFNTTLGPKIFKKYNPGKADFEGQVLISSFEAITPGVARNIDEIIRLGPEAFIDKIKALYHQEDYLKYTSRGIKAIARFKGLTEFSENYFRI